MEIRLTKNAFKNVYLLNIALKQMKSDRRRAQLQIWSSLRSRNRSGLPAVFRWAHGVTPPPAPAQFNETLEMWSAGGAFGRGRDHETNDGGIRSLTAVVAPGAQI